METEAQEKRVLLEKLEQSEGLQQLVDELQTRLKTAEQEHTTELQQRDERVEHSSRQHESLTAKLAAQEQQHARALEELNAKHKASTAELSKTIEDLQTRMQTVHQEHTEALLQKDEAVESQARVAEELRERAVELSKQSDQARATMESARDERLETVQAEMAELQRSKAKELQAKGAEVAKHIEALEDLQTKMVALEQGKTETKLAADALNQQLEELKQSHSDALQLKAEEDEQLLKQIETFKSELRHSGDENQSLKGENEGLRKTLQTLEDISREEQNSAASLSKAQCELDDMRVSVDVLKRELEAAQEKHQQETRDLGEAHAAAIESLRAELDAAAKEHVHQLQAKHDADVAESKFTGEEQRRLIGEKSSALADLEEELQGLKSELSTTSRNLTTTLEERERLLTQKLTAEEAHATSTRLITDLQARHDSLLEDKTAAEDAHSRALDAQKQDGETWFQQQLHDVQARCDALLGEKKAIETVNAQEMEQLRNQIESLQSAAETQRTESDSRTNDVIKELQTQCDDLAEQNRMVAQDRADSAAALKDEISKQYQARIDELLSKNMSLLKGKAATEKENANAIALLKDQLQAEQEEALVELHSKYDALAEQLSQKDQEHDDAVALLKAELQEGHSNDLNILQAKLDELEKTHTGLTEQKASMESAHEEVISELMQGMEAHQSEAVHMLQKKHDALASELLAAGELKNEHEAKMQQLEADLAAKSAQAASASDAGAQQLQQLDAEKDELLRQWQTQLEDLRVELQLDSTLEPASASPSRSPPDGESVRAAIQALKSSHSQALESLTTAEDRMESMKTEVVRKHLAKVEPLEREKAQLRDQVDRLEAILAAGDRVARAAASVGAPRAMDTLSEADEAAAEAADRSHDAGAGASSEVLGTVSPPVLLSLSLCMLASWHGLAFLVDCHC